MAILASLLAGAGASAWAGNGAQNLAFDAISQGLAGAGAAAGYSPAWLVINPAGLARLEGRVDVSADYFLARSRLEPGGVMGNFPVGSMPVQESIYGGTAGAVLPVRGGVFAVGAFPMGGYTLEYPRSVRLLPVLRLEGGDRQNRYQHGRLALGMAWRLENGWTAGVALDMDVKRIRTDHLTLQFQETEGGNSWDESVGLGVTLGVQKQWGRWSAGASYSSRHWMSAFDEYSDLLAYTLDGPQQAQAGLAFRIHPKAELLLDYKWINWSGVAQFGREPMQGGMGWRDQHVVKLGLVYCATPRTTVRAGVSYGASPVDQEHAFVNALAPVMFNTHVTAGLSYQINAQWELHGALVALLPAHVRESGRGDYLGASGAGTKTELAAASVHLGVTRRF